MLRETVGIQIAGRGRAQARQHQLPALAGGFRRLIEREIEIQVDQPGRMFGPLQVTAHPVKTVSNSR